MIDASAEGLTVLPVLSASVYSGLMAEALLAFKDHERITLRGDLAAGLTRVIHRAAETLLNPGPALLVVPPLSLRSVLRRGRHPLQELLRAVRLPSDMRTDPGLLAHSAPVRSAVTGKGQKSKSAVARRRSSALVLRQGAQEQLQDTQVLLVDDVLTTGATLASMYSVLSAAGASVQGAAVLAATPGSPDDPSVLAGQS